MRIPFMSKKKAPQEVKPVPVDPLTQKDDEHFKFCESCQGTGLDSEDQSKVCQVCKGSGTLKA
jgi:hypothetical protein